MTQIQKTNNYDMFKLRQLNDNRESISPKRVQELVDSISQKNLLEYRPIVVNSDMEVIEGQHRFLAAKQLGVDIYYQVKEDFQATDILLMNNAKAWSIADYLNFFVKNGYPEYIKLNEFMKKNQLNLIITLSMVMPRSRQATQLFKEGKFKFVEEEFGGDLETCWETIDLLKRLNGNDYYYVSARFWKPLLKLIRHPSFDKDLWFRNLTRMSSMISAKISEKEYSQAFMAVHNWRNPSKVDLIDEVRNGI